ncbi:MAG: YcxB family protein [Pedobacter sp.]|nr:MAG: YcxB family protein [Pedobacter sp.]
MQITLNYAYTQDQLKRAYRFNIFPTPRAKFFMLFFSCFIFGVGSLFWFFLMPAEMNLPLFNALKYIVMIGLILWSLTLLTVALNYYYLPVYAFKKCPFHKGNFTVNLITQGLAYKQQIVQQNRINEKDGFVHWGAFNKKAENEEFILLFIGRKQSILPKSSFMSTAELEEFRLFLMEQQHIKTKKFNGTEIWNKP